MKRSTLRYLDLEIWSDPLLLKEKIPDVKHQ